MKKLFLILFLMFLSSVVFAGYVQTYKITYDTTTEKSVFTFVNTIQVGTSTDTVYVFLLGTGTVRAKEGVFNYLFGNLGNATGIEMELTNGATIAGRLNVQQITSGDAGSADDIWTKFASSDSWGEPAAGGVGGNKNQAAITHKASAFWTDGYSNNAVTIKKQFEVDGSTKSVIYGKLTDSGDNYITCDGVMSKAWNDANFLLYTEFITTGTAAGDVWLEHRFSTAPFDSGSFVSIQTTVTVSGIAWEKGVTETTGTVTGTGLADGKGYMLEIWRISSDSCTQDIYYKNTYLDIAAD